MPARAEPEARDSLATQTSFVEPVGTPTAEQFEVIRDRFIDERAGEVARPSDLFAFRLIACSDGLDSYFTRHDIDTGLVRFVDDLSKGQSVLGNHDYGTFSYGSSFGARLVDADATRQEYEPTSWRTYDDPGLRTTKWVVGDYYIVRDVELNNQKSNDLIRAMQYGAVRKTSITFAASQFICSVCDRDLLDGFWSWDGVDEDGNELCLHFPGVTYEREGKRVLCWAKMKDEELYETSMVYKNASPSSMYLRKAEVMARSGLLPGSEVVRLEQRLNMRLPRPEGRIWTPGSAKEESVTKKRHTEGEPTPAQPEDQTEEPEEQTEDTESQTDETEATTPEGTEPAGDGQADVVAQFVEASSATIAAFPGLSTAELDTVADVERQIERALGERNVERRVGAMTARQFEARSRAVEEVLGEPATAESVRSLKADADLGQTLYAQLVSDAVAARVRAQGEGNFNRERYEALLRSGRDAEYVRDEIKSWDDMAKTKFKGGRQVEPKEPADAPDSQRPKDVRKVQPNEGQEPILAARQKEK